MGNNKKTHDIPKVLIIISCVIMVIGAVFGIIYSITFWSDEIQNISNAPNGVAGLYVLILPALIIPFFAVALVPVMVSFAIIFVMWIVFWIMKE